MRHIYALAASAALCACVQTGPAADPAHSHAAHVHSGGVTAPASPAVDAAFDIVHARISTEDGEAKFHMAVSGKAGAVKPAKHGQLAGASVFSYVWPTSLDPYEVGFEHKAGILALAVTAHPDFDDTPLEDENGDNRNDNDGDLWHSHWVVLAANETCGPGALAVIDIPEGPKPRLPRTWPGLPLLIDSPGYRPSIAGDTVEVRIPLSSLAGIEGITFDGVTAGLRVNQSVHAPLLCVADVFDIASGDLSLPGKVNK